jgi:hypothetical protein
MPDLFHFDSGTGYATETEGSNVPALVVGSFATVPAPAGTAALWARALAVLALLPYEVRWTQPVNRGGITYATAKNTRVRCASFGVTGSNRTLTGIDTQLSWTPPAAGRRSEAPPVDPADIEYAVDVWYGPRSALSTLWRPRRYADLATGGTLNSASAGDIIITPRRGVWEFAIVAT